MIITETELIKYPSINIGKAKDLTNQQFERLKVMYRVQHPNNKKGVFWLCKCDCGKYVITYGQNLITGKTKSCGCLSQELSSQRMKIFRKNVKEPWNKKDLVGQQIGEWTVLRLDEQGGDKNHRKWICQCSCGKIKSVFGCNLGRISFSCGHQHIKSVGEEQIKKILIKNNIPFETQKVMFQFNKHGNAPFDFYVNNQYLIEYDGTTHYKAIGGWNTEESVIAQQKRDEIKTKWCKENNIPLIRIPYTHLKELCLEDLLLETSKYIV